MLCFSLHLWSLEAGLVTKAKFFSCTTLSTLLKDTLFLAVCVSVMINRKKSRSCFLIPYLSQICVPQIMNSIALTPLRELFQNFLKFTFHAPLKASCHTQNGGAHYNIYKNDLKKVSFPPYSSWLINKENLWKKWE